MDRIDKALALEKRATDLFFEVATSMQGRHRAFQLMRDDDFVHRRDRTANDIHLFLELQKAGYFHLRAYVRHMLDHAALVDEGKIFLTGYLKEGINQIGGIHSLRQDWYDADATGIAGEITGQNPDIF